MPDMEPDDVKGGRRVGGGGPSLQPSPDERERGPVPSPTRWERVRERAIRSHYAAHKRAQSLRREATDAERKLWPRLRAKRFQSAKFRRQHAIGPYIADFCSPGLRLVIEVDGGQHGEQVEAEQRRTSYLEKHGYRVIRFWNNQVLTEMESVLDRIAMGMES